MRRRAGKPAAGRTNFGTHLYATCRTRRYPPYPTPAAGCLLESRGCHYDLLRLPAGSPVVGLTVRRSRCYAPVGDGHYGKRWGVYHAASRLGRLASSRTFRFSWDFATPGLEPVQATRPVCVGTRLSLFGERVPVSVSLATATHRALCRRTPIFRGDWSEPRLLAAKRPTRPLT